MLNSLLCLPVLVVSLKDVVKNDRSSPDRAARLFELFQTWAGDRPRLNYQLAIVQRQEPYALVGCCGLRSGLCETGEMEFGI